MVTAPAQPSPLPRPALDSHTHLDMITLPISEVVASARAAGDVPARSGAEAQRGVLSYVPVITG